MKAVIPSYHSVIFLSPIFTDELLPMIVTLVADYKLSFMSRAQVNELGFSI